MHKRFHGQRQHIIHSLDSLLYQLHTLSFFLSPSIWIYTCRMLSQFQYSKPRELDPTRSLRFFYAMVLLFNLPCLWYHYFKEAGEGRIIVLDFIGMSYSPSETQLCFLDIIIITLQLLLTTIAYETSVYYDNDESESLDLLLPGLETSLSIPLFQSPIERTTDSSQPKTNSMFNVHDIPLVVDLHLDSIMTHFRQPPSLRRANSERVLSVPTTTQWFPGMLIRTTRRLREAAGVNGRPPMGSGGRIPGALDNGTD
ncbi:hypothetical protein BDN70DRAFT_864359 [Pholiota conissans]|uniref:DUF1746 domain-containing protein n=1 Tax=Pholiota conissans TaxID=109636 RepID=A0A9P6CQF9_9AGAR|nr:hypothetical protein BDN70DRAFT_864359 [Pholiota conissans]